MPDKFLLVELPNYDYPLNLACPDCYAPLYSRTRSDGRCDSCLKSKANLPVNYRRAPKRREEEAEPDYS